MTLSETSASQPILSAVHSASGQTGEAELRRLEGIAKLTGSVRYLDDLPLSDHLWGTTVRFPAPRGRVRDIRFGSHIDWSEYVIVDHTGIPGRNQIRLIENDQPVLVERQGRHLHEPVLLLAHASRDALRRAREAVEILVEPLEPILDPTAPPRPSQIQHGEDNVLARITIEKGDPENALRRAAHVIDRTYATGAQEHLYIEPQAMAAWLESDTLVVTGSMQCPFYVLNALMWALARDENRVRVVQAATGGGFGGKEDYPSILAVHAALLAIHADRPVKMVYDRQEDMAATTKRHPARIRQRTGVDPDGRLVAQDIEVVLDGGAYTTLSPVVLSRALIHAAGPYRCDHVRIRGRAMLTNSVPYGAFRGFGAPQVQFANERQMDLLAETVGVDPVTIRERNLLRDGDSTATRQVIDDTVDRRALLQSAVTLSRYEQRNRDCERSNRTHPWLRRGVGISTSWHGSGFTGSGEEQLRSRVRVEGRPGGRVVVLTAATEIGQGATTTLAQIAGRRLGIDPAAVSISTPDTAAVPNSGPTVASRTSMVVGRLVEEACDALRRSLGSDDITGDDLIRAIAVWHRAGRGELSGEAEYSPPAGRRWDPTRHRGDAYEAFSWAACIAEVEVDLRTFTARVVNLTSVQEVGALINPPVAAGQVRGGVAQALGWALTEDCQISEGALRNTNMSEYLVPTALDVPPIRVDFFRPEGSHREPSSKGLGELPMNGPAPAIASAIARALGIEVNSLPLTPSRLMELVGT